MPSSNLERFKVDGCGNIRLWIGGIDLRVSKGTNFCSPFDQPSGGNFASFKSQPTRKIGRINCPPRLGSPYEYPMLRIFEHVLYFTASTPENSSLCKRLHHSRPQYCRDVPCSAGSCTPRLFQHVPHISQWNMSHRRNIEGEKDVDVCSAWNFLASWTWKSLGLKPYGTGRTGGRTWFGSVFCRKQPFPSKARSGQSKIFRPCRFFVHPINPVQHKNTFLRFN